MQEFPSYGPGRLSGTLLAGTINQEENHEIHLNTITTDF